jgi:hypothetical protein
MTGLFCCGNDAGIVGDYFPHSFRATGITNFLEMTARHSWIRSANSRTTKLYDRRGQKVLLETWRGLGNELEFKESREDFCPVLFSARCDYSSDVF